MFGYLDIDGDEIYGSIAESGDFSTRNIINNIMNAIARKENKTRWGEKSPGHEMYLDQNLEDFPGAKVLFMIKDPRGMASSMNEVPWGIKSMIVLVKIWKMSYR